mmetsp:Transcript_21272/g.44384  ORF Transcript_21272/g.44384 Transcript_21272/m.44384 type:complete len:253 (-) Transcript_21272:1727-2485(-)
MADDSSSEDDVPIGQLAKKPAARARKKRMSYKEDSDDEDFVDDPKPPAKKRKTKNGNGRDSNGSKKRQKRQKEIDRLRHQKKEDDDDDDDSRQKKVQDPRQKTARAKEKGSQTNGTRRANLARHASAPVVECRGSAQGLSVGADGACGRVVSGTVRTSWGEYVVRWGGDCFDSVGGGGRHLLRRHGSRRNASRKSKDGTHLHQKLHGRLPTRPRQKTRDQGFQKVRLRTHTETLGGTKIGEEGDYGCGTEGQ